MARSSVDATKISTTTYHNKTVPVLNLVSITIPLKSLQRLYYFGVFI